MRSPGRIRITLPGSTSSGSTSSTVPSSASRFADSGAMLIISAIDCRDLPTAQLWNSSPIW